MCHHFHITDDGFMYNKANYLSLELYYFIEKEHIFHHELTVLAKNEYICWLSNYQSLP